MSSSQESNFLGNCHQTDDVVIIEEARLYTRTNCDSNEFVDFTCTPDMDLDLVAQEKGFSSQCNGNTPEKCLRKWENVAEDNHLLFMTYNCIPGETRCLIKDMNSHSL